MVIERFRDGAAEAVYRRFREKGRMLPEGLRYVNSWVEAKQARCFQLMECENIELFEQWVAHWNDLVDFEIVAVRKSNDVAAAFGTGARDGAASHVHLREVIEADLAELFEHQRDPVACEMAAFPPRDWEAFTAHWQKILADHNVVKRTILLGSEVAGNAVCWKQAGEQLVGYWLGRRFWGQGVASRALSEFVSAIPTRPLHAHVAKTNVASIRVLEKCGFQVTGESRTAAPTGGEAVEEIVYSLLP